MSEAEIDYYYWSNQQVAIAPAVKLRIRTSTRGAAVAVVCFLETKIRWNIDGAVVAEDRSGNNHSLPDFEALVLGMFVGQVETAQKA